MDDVQDRGNQAGRYVPRLRAGQHHSLRLPRVHGQPGVEGGGVGRPPQPLLRQVPGHQLGPRQTGHGGLSAE